MRIILLIHLVALLLAGVSFAQVRTVNMKPDDILTVKAALGIATIVQVPEVIQSAVIGDQSGFKVEYLDKAVTIKPLRWGVKTNLYLFTEKRRYNLRLLTLKQNAADYIVYIKPPFQNPQVKWKQVSYISESGPLSIKIQRIGISQGDFVLIDAKIICSGFETQVKPDQFWITQNGISKVINGLFISDTKVSKNKPLLVGISLSRSDLEAKKPIFLELRAKDKVKVQIPEATVWQ